MDTSSCGQQVDVTVLSIAVTPKAPFCYNHPVTSYVSPCFQVAELLGDHLAQVYAQSVHDALRQVHVG